MTRYRINRLPRAGWCEDELFDDDAGLVPNLEVDGPGEVDTGLVDVDGHSIMRLPPPIGFGRDEEW